MRMVEEGIQQQWSEWMRGLGLGLTKPVGTGRVLGMCMCLGCGGVGAVGGVVLCLCEL